jgi:type I restriction enzyme S subunit
MINWQNVKLGDICELIAGFAFKSKDFGDFTDKVIKITNIEPPFVNMTNLAGIDLSQYNKSKLEKFEAKRGDYVLAMTGATIGKLGRVCSGKAYINQRVLMFKSQKEIDKNFN